MFISSIFATSFYLMVYQYNLPSNTLQSRFKCNSVFEYQQLYDCHTLYYAFDDLEPLDEYYYDIQLHYVDDNGDYLVARGGIENVDSDTPYELDFSYSNQFQSNLKFVLSVIDVENDDAITSHTFDTLKGDIAEFEYELVPNASHYVDFEVNFSLSLYPQYIYEDILDGSYTDGFNDGFNTGKTDGYQDGYDVGKTDGYQDGYDTGRTDGYTQGYNTALNTHDFSFTNLFASISDTPILMIRRMFSFGIFGVSAISILLSLFTCLIFIKIIKKMW